MSGPAGVLAITVPRGQYRGDSWPEVVACGFPGCVVRAPASLVSTSWRCADHDDTAQRTILELGQDMADRAHAELVAPPTFTDAEQHPPRRYRPAPSPRV